MIFHKKCSSSKSPPPPSVVGSTVVTAGFTVFSVIHLSVNPEGPKLFSNKKERHCQHSMLLQQTAQQSQQRQEDRLSRGDMSMTEQMTEVFTSRMTAEGPDGVVGAGLHERDVRRDGRHDLLLPSKRFTLLKGGSSSSGGHGRCPCCCCRRRIQLTVLKLQERHMLSAIAIHGSIWLG